MAFNKEKDNKAIEGKAMLCFKEYIVDSRVISELLVENDKEPCWDGHIYLYSDPAKDKKHLIGRVPIQVKGTEVKRFELKKFMFTIEMSDLKAYLHEPTVYVVCQEKEGSKERELFYRCLLPETVKHILKGKEKQKTVNVLMHRIPESLDEFENLMKVFYGESKKQLSFADKRPFTMDDVKIRGIRDFSLLLPTKQMDPVEQMKYLSTHPSYLYAKIDKEIDFEVPVADGPMTFIFRQDVKKDVSVGGRVFFRDFINVIKDGKMVITIGNMLTIIIPMDEKSSMKTEIKTRNHSTLLKDTIKYIDFLLAMNDEGALTIDNLTMQVKVNEQNLIDEFRNTLLHCKALQEVLDKLHVTKDFDLSGITAEQGFLIDILLETLGKGKAVKLNELETKVTLMEISNVKLLLWCSVGKGGMCMLGDFFDAQIEVKCKISESELVEASPYLYLLNDNLWEKCDNIPYNELIASYKELTNKHEHVYEMANTDLLYMLKAYDALETTDKDKSVQLMKAASELNEWMLTNDHSDERHLTHLVNHYQIIKRHRCLENEEVDLLQPYLKVENLPASMKAGISLLLDDESSFTVWYEQCTENDKKLLASFPIWRFKK